jgi:hypothetical protein
MAKEWTNEERMKHLSGQCDCQVGFDGIRSLPADQCEPLHQQAVEEAGFCPVCQH